MADKVITSKSRLDGFAASWFKALCEYLIPKNRMRDPERIEQLLGLLKDIWAREPDLRFNQLLYILQSGYSEKNDKKGKIEEAESDGFSRTGFDLFNVEDDSFVEYLREVKSNEKIT